MASRLFGYRLALFFAIGAIAGIVVAPQLSMDMRSLVLTVIIIAATAFLTLLYKDRKENATVALKPLKQLPSGSEESSSNDFLQEATADEVLSPDEARKWLDDFLVTQQRK